MFICMQINGEHPRFGLVSIKEKLAKVILFKDRIFMVATKDHYFSQR